MREKERKRNVPAKKTWRGSRLKTRSVAWIRIKVRTVEMLQKYHFIITLYWTFPPYPTLKEPSQLERELQTFSFILHCITCNIPKQYKHFLPFLVSDSNQHEMAKRSDFAQKLLDDLRLRKERLAATQSSDRKTNTSIADAYSYAKKNYRGTREFKTAETTDLRIGTSQSRSKGFSKSFTIGETSKQVVPFGRGQNTEKLDLSKVLSFALENGGKLGRIDFSGNNSILALLNQLGGRSLDHRKMQRSSIDSYQSSTSHFPALSHLHLKEISRGAQKLNQILTACCDGLNFNRYSIEIGKELLKGATDLEESLRMLINLQDASEYMVSPQRKSRITLLEEDEDEDEDDNDADLAQQKQLARPRFSFDKPSRNYSDFQEVARNDLKLRLAAISYSSASHNQSVKSSNSSQSKPEKARIPNVIAKLMGLEELPANVDLKYTTQKNSGPKVEEKLLKKVAQGHTKKAKKRTEDAENLTPPTSKQKITKTNSSAVQNSVALQADTDIKAHNASFQEVISDGKLPCKASSKVHKQQSVTSPLNQYVGSPNDIHEKHREHRVAERSKMKEPVLKDEQQRMAPYTPKRSEATVMSQEKIELLKEGVLQRENVYTNKLVTGTQQKSQTNLGLQQTHILQKLEPLEEKLKAEEKGHQSAKQKLPARKLKGGGSISSMHNQINLKKQAQINHAAVSKKSFTEAVDAMRSERFPDGERQKDLTTNTSSTSLNVNSRPSLRGNSNKDTPARDVESKLAESKPSDPPLLGKKPVRDPNTWHNEIIRVHKKETPRLVNEVMVRRGSTQQHLARPQKHQNSILQEVKRRKHGKLLGLREANQVRAGKPKEREVSIIKSNKSVACSQPTNVAQEPEREAQEAPILRSPAEHENRSSKETRTPVANENRIISIAMSDLQSEGPLFHGDVKIKPYQIIESNPLNGKDQGSVDITYRSLLEYQKISRTETAKPLTESENHLKQILIKSQIFLNTAEALFKLNIPFNILDAGGPDCQDEDSKLMLDCGYEIMKRKGRRQELSVHPFIKVSITATKVTLLEDLVRQLDKDIEKLKFYSGNENGEVILEDFLAKILENDVYNKDPDVNCMWDLSWNEMMFAFIEKDDVIRDVERYVLCELVDEITRDLLNVPISAF